MAKLNPYVSFKDNAREALEFWQSALGGELSISVFSDVPEVAGMLQDESEKSLVMHGQLDAPGGLTLMAADTGSSMPYEAPTSGVTVALTGGPEDLEYIRGAYEALSDGASDVMPLDLAPWGDHYGQLTDRYGITWMFDVGPEE
ncbi:VOC family protein [Puerhibacterium sp. TATVAM-FAB25]|uniref:VOC family protein n=1 Tax=Puerhibacterium sp. TATVAM-FAB25 TaxID=3093699 RepID=UPI00397AFDFD